RVFEGRVGTSDSQGRCYPRRRGRSIVELDIVARRFSGKQRAAQAPRPLPRGGAVRQPAARSAAQRRPRETRARAGAIGRSCGRDRRPPRRPLRLGGRAGQPTGGLILERLSPQECVSALEAKLEVAFANSALGLAAVTHKSYSNEHREISAA